MSKQKFLFKSRQTFALRGKQFCAFNVLKKDADPLLGEFLMRERWEKFSRVCAIN